MKYSSMFAIALAMLLGHASSSRTATPLPALDLSVPTSLGTTRPEEIMNNRIVPYAGAHLGGVHVDTSKTPNRFYVWDTLNNRVLGYNGFKAATVPNHHRTLPLVNLAGTITAPPMAHISS